MRMILLLAAALPLIATTAPGTVPKKPCKPTTTMTAERQPARIRPLAAMPPAKQLYGVYHEEGGCSVPIVLREKVGDTPRQ